MIKKRRNTPDSFRYFRADIGKNFGPSQRFDGKNPTGHAVGVRRCSIGFHLCVPHTSPHWPVCKQKENDMRPAEPPERLTVFVSGVRDGQFRGGWAMWRASGSKPLSRRRRNMNRFRKFIKRNPHTLGGQAHSLDRGAPRGRKPSGTHGDRVHETVSPSWSGLISRLPANLLLAANTERLTVSDAGLRRSHLENHPADWIS